MYRYINRLNAPFHTKKYHTPIHPNISQENPTFQHTRQTLNSEKIQYTSIKFKMARIRPLTRWLRIKFTGTITSSRELSRTPSYPRCIILIIRACSCIKVQRRSSSARNCENFSPRFANFIACSGKARISNFSSGLSSGANFTTGCAI